MYESDISFEIYTFYEVIKADLFWYKHLGQLDQIKLLNRAFNTNYTIVQFEAAICNCEWLLQEDYELNQRKEIYYGIRNTG